MAANGQPFGSRIALAPSSQYHSPRQPGTHAASPSLSETRFYRERFDAYTNNRYLRSVDKSKGLRHFSTKVCEKVKEKGTTSYNEVADELVSEYFNGSNAANGDSEKQQYDMKNIRRRVYDALNVLMAMNIIEKEKKEIRWVGLPASSMQQLSSLEDEIALRNERLREKTERLQNLIIRLVVHKMLIMRNREREAEEGRPVRDSLLHLPFIILNTDRNTQVECAIAHDKSEYVFTFEQPYELTDDVDLLKRLGLSLGLDRGEVKDENHDTVKQCLPAALRHYVDEILNGTLLPPYEAPEPAPVAPPPHEMKNFVGQHVGHTIIRRPPMGLRSQQPPVIRTTGRYQVIQQSSNLAGPSRYGGAVVMQRQMPSTSSGLPLGSQRFVGQQHVQMEQHYDQMCQEDDEDVDDF